MTNSIIIMTSNEEQAKSMSKEYISAGFQATKAHVYGSPENCELQMIGIYRDQPMVLKVLCEEGITDLAEIMESAGFKFDVNSPICKQDELDFVCDLDGNITET